MAYLKQTLKDLHEERKRDVPLPVYIFWWVVRLLVIYGAIKSVINHNTLEIPQMIANIFVCFIFTFFKIFPKEKFLLSRLSFKIETVVILLNLMTTYLGSYIRFYETIPAWDMMVHFVFSIIGVYVSYEVLVAASKKRKDLEPIVGALSGFGLCTVGGVFWEIYEFTVDQISGRNVQHWDLSQAANGKGVEIFHFTNPMRYALLDTMSDLIFAFVGAIIGTVILYYWLKKRAKKAAAKPEQEADVMLPKV